MCMSSWDYSLWSPLACLHQQCFICHCAAWCFCFGLPEFHTWLHWSTRLETSEEWQKNTNVPRAGTKHRCLNCKERPGYHHDYSGSQPGFAPLCGSAIHAWPDKATSKYLQSHLSYTKWGSKTSMCYQLYPSTPISLHCIFPFVHSPAPFCYCVRTEVWVINCVIFSFKSQIFFLICVPPLSALPLVLKVLFSSFSYLPKTDWSKSMGK